MTLLPFRKIASLAALSMLTAADPLFAAADTTDLAAELSALKARIAELEKLLDNASPTTERTAQIRAVVEDVLADARKRGQLADSPDAGYHDGFYLQTPDHNFKLAVGGFLQVRYEFAQSNATHNRTLPSRSFTSAGGATIKTTPSDPGDANGFDIRRARINFSGNVFSPDVTFRLEGDFYGGSAGGFTVTDAFVGYRWSDLLKIKAGSFKVPFAKSESTNDTFQTFMERAEVLAPFDPVRSLGASLYGDIIKDKLAYEISANDGGNANTLRRADTAGSTANLDNRLGFYSRVQYAGSGRISDFVEESDLRTGARDFIWMLGGAVGYESQNAANNAFPSPQTTTSLSGLSSNNSPGFANAAALHGDIFRATLDWSAKWQGLSILTAAYFQQVNQNAAAVSSTSATSPAIPPYGSSRSSFFQHSYYAQLAYFIIPQKLELAARAGALLTEGGPDIGEFYSLGANYYLYGDNAKIQADATYTPEAAYTDAAASLLQNTHDLIFRVQLQLKF